MQLAPQEFFTIVRQIEDPLDSNTYFPQSEVRNARTDALVEIVDLESKGDQRYSERFQVPADVSGLGFYISIVTKVYEDSDHTQESANYGRREQTFLVKDRDQRLGGGSNGLSADAVEKILRKVLPEFVKNPEKINLKPLIKAIGEVPLLTADRITIPEVKFPAQKPVDFSGVIKAVNSSRDDVLVGIADIDIPDPKKALESISGLIKGIETSLNKADIEGAIKLLPQLNEELQKIPEHIEKVNETEKKLQDTILVSRSLVGTDEKKQEAPLRSDPNRNITRLFKRN